ncbi:hypothetical protein AAVH_43156, partial [Aphelenchoides avenae]
NVAPRTARPLLHNRGAGENQSDYQTWLQARRSPRLRLSAPGGGPDDLHSSEHGTALPHVQVPERGPLLYDECRGKAEGHQLTRLHRRGNCGLHSARV